MLLTTIRLVAILVRNQNTEYQYQYLRFSLRAATPATPAVSPPQTVSCPARVLEPSIAPILTAVLAGVLAALRFIFQKILEACGARAARERER